ncbi:PhzF family phenazine biosynthesis protein [Lysobacter sp. A286]
MSKLDFAIIDVFAESPLSGNPLAVVSGGDALPDDVLRAVAREFNQAETTFVHAPMAAGADRKLRSFTASGAEVFGAGHNALGAWLWLAETGQLGDLSTEREFWQEIGPLVLPVRIKVEGGRASAVMTQGPPEFLAYGADMAGLADALGIDPQDICSPPPQVVSTGAPHLLVAVRTRADVDKARPDAQRLLTQLGAADGEGCYLFSMESNGDDITAYARFFNPTVGLWEDSATGTAAGPLAASLDVHGLVERGRPIVIEQGRYMGRPSRLNLDLRHGVKLSGSGVIVMTGALTL